MNASFPGLRKGRRAAVAAAAAILGGLAPVAAPVARTIDGTVLYIAQAPARPAQQHAVSLEEAVTIATEQVPGRVVKAETVTENSRTIHEVLIIQRDGRVRTVRIDPDSGETL